MMALDEDRVGGTRGMRKGWGTFLCHFRDVCVQEEKDKQWDCSRVDGKV